MTAAAQGAHPTSARRAGTAPTRAARRRRPSALTRLTLRRDRRASLAWAGGAVALAVYCVVAFSAMYATAAERSAAATLYSSPAAVVFTGPGYGLDVPDPGIGALFAGEVLLYLALVVVLAGALTAVARTRGDEEAGPGELLRAAPVTAGAPARAALASITVTGLLAGAGCTLATVASGLEMADAVGLGLGLLVLTWCGAGLGLVAGGLAPTARSARGLAMLAVIAWVALRGIGDVSDSAGWLSWTTPIGLLQQMRLWAGLRWVPLVLAAVMAAVLVGVGLAMHARRELGEGVLALGSGGRSRRRGPRGPIALALRVSAPTRAWWMVGGLLFGATYGIFAPVVETSFAALFEENPALSAFVGGELTIATYVRLIVGYGGILAAACAVVLALGAVKEEEQGRAGTVLAGPVSRWSWLAGRLVVTVLGSGGVLAGSALGLVGSAVPLLVAGGSLDADGGARLALGALLGLVAHWPAALLLGALVTAVQAALPRLARPLGWGVLTVALALTLFAPMVQAPQWVVDLSPFTHVPRLPTDGAAGTGAGGGSGWVDVAGPGNAWIGPAVCVVAALVLVAVARRVLERRDLVA